jgi:hypothetical protein
MDASEELNLITYFPIQKKASSWETRVSRAKALAPF